MTPEQRKAMQQALDVLGVLHDDNLEYLTLNKLGGKNNRGMVLARKTIAALRTELAKPEQVPLTEEQVFYLLEANTKWMPAGGFWRLNEVKFARAIEAAQKKHYRK
jgi:hypothetical protein